MKKLHKMTLKSFVTSFLVSLIFFMMIIELLDLFSNLWRYINNNVPLIEILRVSALYAPKAVFFSLPVAVLFSVSFTLGNLYAKNELIAVFGSGISLYWFVLPLIASGFAISIFMFFFHENVVISTYSRKNEITAELLRTKKTYSNNNVTVMNPTRSVIYSADYYNDNTKTLTALLLIDRRNDRERPVRIDSKWATWDDGSGHWILMDCRRFTFSREDNSYHIEHIASIGESAYDLSPDTFRRDIRNIEEMNIKNARKWISTLKSAGLPHRSQLTDYYKRFSLPFTCLVVSVIAASIGGNFRKNIILMSLLLSLLLSSFYYIMQMVLVLFAKLGHIPPFAGAWGTFVFFIFIGSAIFRYAKT